MSHPISKEAITKLLLSDAWRSVQVSRLRQSIDLKPTGLVTLGGVSGSEKCFFALYGSSFSKELAPLLWDAVVYRRERPGWTSAGRHNLACIDLSDGKPTSESATPEAYAEVTNRFRRAT